MASKNNKGILTSGQTAQKTFEYELDGVKFSFTMRVDVKTQLKAGIEILKKAQADFEAELKTIK